METIKAATLQIIEIYLEENGYSRQQIIQDCMAEKFIGTKFYNKIYEVVKIISDHGI